MNDEQPRPGQHGPLLTIRPKRIIIFGAIAAIAVLAAMIIVVVLLESELEKQNFRMIDRFGLLGMGVFGAGLIMLVARPRLRADASGLWVRNVLGETYFSWEWIERIAFPAGAHWAQLILPDDETYPMMAVQAMDKQRAVAHLQQLRALFDEHAPARSVAAASAESARRRQAEVAAAGRRPLGRLEQIDREKSADRPRDKRHRR